VLVTLHDRRTTLEGHLRSDLPGIRVASIWNDDIEAVRLEESPAYRIDFYLRTDVKRAIEYSKLCE
jgi:hypothetical protein